MRGLTSHLYLILILVPGFVEGDLSPLLALLGVPVVKGPRYASDIPFSFHAELLFSSILIALLKAIKEYLISKVGGKLYSTPLFRQAG